MDLRFTDAQPTAAERKAVERATGITESQTHDRVRTAANLRIFRTGRQSVVNRRHLLLPALETVQSEVGWVSEGALMHICRVLSVPSGRSLGSGDLLLTDIDGPLSFAGVAHLRRHRVPPRRRLGFDRQVRKWRNPAPRCPLGAVTMPGTVRPDTGCLPTARRDG